MPGFGEQLAMQMGGQAMSGIMGLALGGINDQRQLNQQGRLQDLQIRGNKDMMDYSYQKQLQMWKDTNYQAQMEQMKKAGLNPALIYGQSGAGGQTTGSGSGGGVTGGEAPKGGREVQDMTAMGIQYQLLQAQKENIEADTENKKAQSTKTSGVDTAAATQGINNAKAQETLTRVDTELRQVQASVGRQTILEQIETIGNIAQKGSAEITQLQLSNQLDQTTMDSKIKIIKQEAIGAVLNNVLKRRNITLTEERKRQITNEITMSWEQLSNDKRKVRLQELLRDDNLQEEELENIMKGINPIIGIGAKGLEGNKTIIHKKQ